MAIQFDNSNGGTLTIKPPSSGSYNVTWPSSNGSSGQVLSTDGAGTLSWVTVGGATGFTPALNTTGTNATTNVSSLTASGGTTDQNFGLVPKGTGSLMAAIPDSLAAGGNVRGNQTLDLQMARSVNTQVASGNNAVIAGGSSNNVQADKSIVFGGINNMTSGYTYHTCFGGSSHASWSNFGTTLGGINGLPNGDYSCHLGGYLSNARYSQYCTLFNTGGATGGGGWGFHQWATYVLGNTTTDAIAVTLANDTAAANLSNQVSLSTNSMLYFQARIVAAVTGAGNTKSWIVTGVIRQGASAATTVLLGTPTITSDFADAGAASWGLSVTANTSVGCITFTATGQAATTIRWTAVVNTTQVGF